MSSEWCDDAPMFALASVLGREHQLDAKMAEEGEVKELAIGSSAVKQHRRHGSFSKSVCELGEGSQSDATGNHPRFGGWLDDCKRMSQRTEAVDQLAGTGCVQQAGRHAYALVEYRDAGRCAAIIAKHLEDRKRASQ